MGEYRVFNQFDEAYALEEVAVKVAKVAQSLGLSAEIEHIENPRVEDEDVSHYNPICERLRCLGFCPVRKLEDELEEMLSDLKRYCDRIKEKESQILPKIGWDRKPLTPPAARRTYSMGGSLPPEWKPASLRAELR